MLYLNISWCFTFKVKFKKCRMKVALYILTQVFYFLELYDPVYSCV